MHTISAPVLTSGEGVLSIKTGSFSTADWGNDKKPYTDNLNRLSATPALSRAGDRIEIVWEKKTGLLENHDWYVK